MVAATLTASVGAESPRHKAGLVCRWRFDFNRVTFTPVTTSTLRLEAQLQSKSSSRMLEWRIGVTRTIQSTSQRLAAGGFAKDSALESSGWIARMAGRFDQGMQDDTLEPSRALVERSFALVELCGLLTALMGYARRAVGRP